METGVKLEELCELVRVVSYYFIKKESISAVLTSKRVSMLAKPDHLERKRKLELSLTQDFME